MRKQYTLATAFLLFVAQAHAQPAFTDGTASLGHQANSGGCMAITDMDGDGMDDVVQLDYGTHVYVLYQNGDGTFTEYDYGIVDSGPEWGWAIGDLANDGFKDICSGSYGQTNFLSITGRGEYTLSDLDGPPIFTQNMSMGDMDNDGHVDVYACNDTGAPNIWFTNASGVPINDNDYIDWTTSPSSDMSGNYGSSFTDFDNDGDLDLHISHCRQGVNDPDDPRRWDRMFVNDGTNHYEDLALEYGLQSHDQTWTSDLGDFDNDGDLDLVSTNHNTSITLFLNDGTGHFTNITAGSGLAGTTGFMLQGMFRDLDNDGFLDVLIAGGIERYFQGHGDGTFTQVDGLFPYSKAMHGFAFGDLNRDGFEDVYANYGNDYVDGSASDPDRLWLNTPNGNHFFRVALQGVESNRDAIGARVTITGPWGTQIREVRSGESYGLVNSFILTFGLGTADMVETLTVRWPSGLEESFNDLHADQTLSLVEGTCISPNVVITATPDAILCTGGGSATLTVDAGFDYLWNTGETSQSIVTSTPGTYWTMITGDGTCATQVSVNVLLDPDETPTVTLDGPLTFCSNDQVTLTSSVASGYLWNNGSFEQSITVSTSGAYTVTVDGVCDAFTSAPVTLTAVQTPAAPSSADVNIPDPGTAVLVASGDSVVWYDVALDGSPVGTGSPWTTPTISATSTFWCANVAQDGGELLYGGRMDQSTTGGYQNNASYYLLFSTTQDMVINSVKVYADGAYDREIGVVDMFDGSLITSGTYAIPDGESRVQLDMLVPGGGSYGLRVMNGNPSLWRDALGSNPDYPYALGTLGTITGSNASSGNQLEYYYFFYDWEVSTPATYCPGPRTAVEVSVGPVGVEDHPDHFGMQVFPNPALDLIHITVGMNIVPVSLDVLDIAGRVVLTQHSFVTGSIEVPIGSIASGGYTIRLRSADGMYMTRFIKQ